MKATKIIIPLLVWFPTTSFHPFYLSVAELNIKADEKKIELAIKCFNNDLEDALRKINNTKTDLISSIEKQKNNKLLKSYFENRFKTLINSKRIEFSFLGFEVDEDVIWTYFEASCKLKNGDSLIVENTVLYDFLPQQTNLTHVKWKGGSKSFKKINPDAFCGLKFSVP